MEHQDYLLTFAEVAAAFAGFSAVVASFVRERETSVLRINHYRTRVMIEYSLCVVIFAFLPYLLYILLQSAEQAWRISSLLLSIVWAVVAVTAGRRVKLILGKTGYVAAPVFSYLVSILTVVGVIILVLNAFGFWLGKVAGVFLLGLFIPLLQSALYFLHMVTHSRPIEG